jgi:hypothetical protein
MLASHVRRTQAAMPLTDEDTAIAAIATLSELSAEQEAAHAKIQLILHDGDANPFVDVHELFRLYSSLYFRSLLLPRVEVSWSPRLTLCAGMCELVKDDEGKYRRIRLKLSEPLLKYRPQSDTVNTLLHEAIHAYFFITTSWAHSRGDDGTGHGAGFLLLADAINNHGSYEVTVYHTFHDEVDSYRTHVWLCDGPCKEQPPFFGLVKRTMNRAPGKSDTWWKKHEEECRGIYTKIMEPALTKKQLEALSAKERAGRQKNKIDAWIKLGAKGDGDRLEKRNTTATHLPQGIVPNARASLEQMFDTKGPTGTKRTRSPGSELPAPPAKQSLVSCPICDQMVPEGNINEHLDHQHPP